MYNLPEFLPTEIQRDIDRAGGWFVYRDLVIIENLSPKELYKNPAIRKRINQRMRKPRI